MIDLGRKSLTSSKGNSSRVGKYLVALNLYEACFYPPRLSISPTWKVFIKSLIVAFFLLLREFEVGLEVIYLT